MENDEANSPCEDDVDLGRGNVKVRWGGVHQLSHQPHSPRARELLAKIRFFTNRVISKKKNVFSPLFDLESTHSLVRMQLVTSAANWSVAWPSKGVSPPIR